MFGDFTVPCRWYTIEVCSKIGSVAQFAEDSLGDSMVSVGLHEQTRTCDLPHDELALLSSH